MLYKDSLELIGNTPLLKLKRLKEKYKLNANIYAKLESYNLTGSIKDRASLQMIFDFEKENKLKEGSTIIEPTSGNTGIGLACIGKLKGYRVIIVMPENMSIERIKLLKLYDAEVILTNKELGIQGSIDKAKELNKMIPNSIILDQFNNPSNIKVHYETTAQELYDDLNRKVDILVSAIGTSGTIMGCSKFLKEKNKDIKIIGVEPYSSPLISLNKKGPHKIQGIGPNFIPNLLDKTLIDKIELCKDDEAFIYSKILVKEEGIFAGISSGAALCIAIKEALKNENKDKNIVVILPDTGNRYLSNEEFIK